MYLTTLNHVAYFNHPTLGTIRVTWNDGEPDDPTVDPMDLVWFHTTLTNGEAFLTVDHMEGGSIVGGYSVLHNGMEGSYVKERARKIWDALVREGWVPHIDVKRAC